MTELSDARKTEIARQKVEAMTGFYIHAAVFAAVILLLFVIDAATGGVWWVQWPLLGWGAGLALHYALAFTDSISFVSRWQARKIEQLKSDM